MTCTLRPLTATDEPVLWDMLYVAIHVSPGQAAPPRDVVFRPELARYVQQWGRPGDCGILATDPATSEPIGAVWLRHLVGDECGYGYVDDDTPELSMAVLLGYQGQGIGTRLLADLLASDCGRQAISLSVARSNPARRLYERFGWQPVSQTGDTLTLKRNP